VKPSELTIAARAVLVMGSLAAAVLMLLPVFQGAEQYVGLTDKQAHALAFYAFTVCAFLAMPRMRRRDLALAVLAMGAAAEVAQIVTGRSASVIDLSADAVGVFAAWAPAQIEQMRRMARKYPGLSLRQIRALDRRRGEGLKKPRRADADVASAV